MGIIPKSREVCWMWLFLNKDYCCCSLTSVLSNRCGGISIIYRILRLVYARGLLPDPVFCCCSSVLEIRRATFVAICCTCCMVLLTVSSIIASFEIYPSKNRIKIVGRGFGPFLGWMDSSNFVITLRRQCSSRLKVDLCLSLPFWGLIHLLQMITLRRQRT